MRGAAPLLRRTAGSARKRCYSTQDGAACARLRCRCFPHAADHAAGGPAGGEEGEKLGFVTALGARLSPRCTQMRSTPHLLAACSGGLVAASAGAIAVFGLGVMGVMGAAKGAASLLGAC